MRVQDLIGFLSELHSLGIDLALHQQGIDTTTPAGKAMSQMVGVFAEFERSMIVSGCAVASPEPRRAAPRAVKPSGTPLIEPRIHDALATPGRPGFHRIAAQFGVATRTVQRIANG
jgi:DNA invertase Pin-like site-specific DNA recombinase